MKKQHLLVVLFCLTVLFVSCSVFKSPAKNIRMENLFSSNMVVQQGIDVKIWGKADPGGKVTVSLAGQVHAVYVEEDSSWLVSLAPLEYGGPHQLTVKGEKEFVFENVMVGEVWVASGQSNMQWEVRRAMDADAEIAAANYPDIRLFNHDRVASWEPTDKVTCDGWDVCSPETIEQFSAVGYYFGRYLHKELDVPIGIIHTSWGGTPAEAWTSSASLKTLPDYAPIIDEMENNPNYLAGLQAEYDSLLAEWEKLKTSGVEDLPRQPAQPLNPHRPTVLYNAMINPIIPYGIKGAIWYQGESNASRAYQYRSLFKTMITDWRTNWALGDFSFYFVQLANFKERKSAPVDDEWAELREAQTLALELPNTGMAVTIDIGEADDIHPTNKQDVGKRLALNALKKDYGKDIVFSGPVYKGMQVDGNKIIISFDYIGGGLVANGDELFGFAIAGEDKNFTWASAKIEGETVVVSSPYVASPVAVRYAWASNPLCNLYNQEGLPASPFRTDDWPGITWPKEEN